MSPQIYSFHIGDAKTKLLPEERGDNTPRACGRRKIQGKNTGNCPCH